MFGPSKPTNDVLVDLMVATGPDKWNRDLALKSLAKCEGPLDELSRRESLTLLAPDLDGMYTRILAVTSKGVAEVGKKGTDKYFTFGEIAETKLFNHPKGLLVQVLTYTALRDYMPNDNRRYQHIIQIMTATPGAGNMVCAAIDPHLAS
jgi:hypothetical protein